MRPPSTIFLLSLATVGLSLYATGVAAAPHPAPGTYSVYLPIIAKAPPLPDWLNYLNTYRSQAGQPGLYFNDAWNDAAYKHSRYMVETNAVVGYESSTNYAWYTAEGDAVARVSNLFGIRGSGTYTTTDREAIDWWMQAPFHALYLLSPALHTTGFGSYRAVGDSSIYDVQMAATVNVISGTALPGASSYPVRWPANGATITLNAYNGNEAPDPLSHSGCAGYTPPTGVPIILQLGYGSLSTLNVTYTYVADGSPREHCWFTENNYTQPDASLQALGRAILSAHDALVIIPRYPLYRNTPYTVSATVNGLTYTWSFTVAP